MPMLNLRETVNKAEKQLKAIETSMDATGCYHPEDASLYDGLGQADAYEVQQTLNSLSLAELLAKSGTTGIQGAAYLIAAKLHDELIFKSQLTDIVPLISTIPVASQWQGGDLSVNVVDDHSFKPSEFSGGASIPTATVNTKKLTLAPKSFGIVVPITQDMIEDNQYDLMQYHVDKAAMTMGTYASDLALTVLKTATDGWGTVGGGAGDSHTTKFTGGTYDVLDMVAEVGTDGWIANTMVVTPEAWTDQIELTGPAAVLPVASTSPLAAGYNFKIDNLDVLLCVSNSLSVTDATPRVITIIFDRNNALFTGRKRWLEIKNYADPIHDLSKAVITARQDSVSLYNDAVAVNTEAT